VGEGEAVRVLGGDVGGGGVLRADDIGDLLELLAAKLVEVFFELAIKLGQNEARFVDELDG